MQIYIKNNNYRLDFRMLASIKVLFQHMQLVLEKYISDPLKNLTNSLFCLLQRNYFDVKHDISSIPHR